MGSATCERFEAAESATTRTRSSKAEFQGSQWVAIPSQRPRTPSPSGFKPKGKFVFRGGCNHCGKAGHQRAECKTFIALKKNNGGKLLEGYKGAREIAYEKWRNNQKKRFESQKQKESVRTLASNEDTCDDDSDFSESEYPRLVGVQHILCALPSPQAWNPVSEKTGMEPRKARYSLE